MTILLANIGTSDLAIKIDDFYLPLGFDCSEPINFVGKKSSFYIYSGVIDWLLSS